MTSSYRETIHAPLWLSILLLLAFLLMLACWLLLRAEVQAGDPAHGWIWDASFVPGLLAIPAGLRLVGEAVEARDVAEGGPVTAKAGDGLTRGGGGGLAAHRVLLREGPN